MSVRRFPAPSLAAACRRQALLWTALTAVAHASPGPASSNGEENGTGPERKLPAVSLLPAGSVLRKVMIPRYDQQRKLVAVLRTAVMTIVDPQTVEGEQVSLELFNPDRSQRARIDLVKAVFDQRKGTLDARQPVEIAGENFSAKGSGLVYTYEQARGFLLGPVDTRFYAPPPKTSMIRSSSPRAAATAVAAAMIASPASAESPQRLTPGERAELTAQAAPVTAKVDQAQEDTKESIAADQAASTEAHENVAAFAQQAALTEVAIPSPVPAADAKPLDVTPGPNDTVIEAKDGMYFDAEKGILVYLRDVRLTDPRFTLSGANELKVFLEKKPGSEKTGEASQESGKPSKDNAKPGLAGASGGFGEVDRIVATGAVRVIQKATEGKPPVEASAAILTFHAKTGEIVLNGGYPWVKQGDKFMRAKQPDLYLRIQKDGSFVTEGEWEMGGQFSNPGSKPQQP